MVPKKGHGHYANFAYQQYESGVGRKWAHEVPSTFSCRASAGAIADQLASSRKCQVDAVYLRSSVAQCRHYVIGFTVRIVIKDLVERSPGTNQREYVRHPDPHPAYAWPTATLAGFDSDTRVCDEIHGLLRKNETEFKYTSILPCRLDASPHKYCCAQRCLPDTPISDKPIYWPILSGKGPTAS